MRFVVPALFLLSATTTPVAPAWAQTAGPSLAAATAALNNPSIPASGRIEFKVVREDVNIGRHAVSFRRDGALLRVDVTIDLVVTFLGISLYRYSHQASEVWRDDRLVALRTSTDKNGERFSVSGRAEGDGFVVEAGGVERAFPADAMPSSHWNRAWLDGRPLINTQTGQRIDYRATPLGSETVETADGGRQGEHFAISGDLVKDIWFDAGGRWVSSRFKAPDGSTISYLLK